MTLLCLFKFLTLIFPQWGNSFFSIWGFELAIFIHVNPLDIYLFVESQKYVRFAKKQKNKTKQCVCEAAVGCSDDSCKAGGKESRKKCRTYF